MIAAALAFACAALVVAAAAVLWPERRAPRPARLLTRFARGALGGRGAPVGLEQRIVAAGRPAGLGVRELMAAKAASALAAAALGVPFGLVAPGRLGVLVVAAAPAAGFLAPDLWLRRRADARARRVRRELPALLDLLRVSVGAGSSLAAALAEVGERASGPLAAEWRAVGDEVTLGVPLEHALAGMAVRLPQPEVIALCAALDRARRHGAPLGDTLAGQSRDARLALRRRVAEDAAKAGPKIQLVVALLLVPSVLLLVAAALAAALSDSGGVSGI